MNFKDAVETALLYLGHWFGVWYSYGWIKNFLWFWVSNKKAHTSTGIVLSILFCLFGSAILGCIAWFFLKSIQTGLSAFILFLISSFVACYNLYNHPDKDSED